MKENLHTPWSDVVELITFVSEKDIEGFETLTETKHPIFCNWADGVSQSEFWHANKAGLQAGAQAEVYRVDLYAVWPPHVTTERFLDFRGMRFRVIRDFPQTFDTQTLILEGVVR